MGKHNLASGILVLAVVLMIAISTYLIASYTTNILTAGAAFMTSDKLGKLQACGVAPPIELLRLQADIPSLLIPVIYVGLPSLMIIIAILMFVAGYYYGHGVAEGGQSSSETTTTTSTPNRSVFSGRYSPGRRIEQTKTRSSSTRSGRG